MKQWTEIVPRCAVHLPGCPDPFIEEALRDAAIDLLGRTRAWKVRDVPLAITVAGQPNYTVVPPTDAFLSHIHVARAGADELTVALPGQVDDVTGTSAQPADCLIEVFDGTTVRLTPPPSVDGQQIVATVSYIPSPTADGLEDAMYLNRHVREAVECKAKAELMLMPSKPWSSALAAGLLTRYEVLADQIANETGPVRRNPLRVRSWG